MKMIELTRGFVALVDDEDYEKLSLRKWHVTLGGSYYARTCFSGGGYSLMHRQILGLEKGDPRHSDHIDGDGLNNQKHNLRICSASTNQANSNINKTNKSGFKGASWDKQVNKWRASIMVNGKTKHLGYFTCLIKAAHCYDEAAREYFGKFPRFNFPREGEQGCKPN